MLRASISLAVGAPDRAELERRVEALRERFGEVRPAPPARPAARASSSTTCRAPTAARSPDYRQQMTVEQFGAMVPTATAEVGSPSGVYIGHSPGRRAPGPLRPDRGAAHRPALGGAARRHARLGQDDRRAGDRLRRRAPRLAGRRLRPQARPRPRPASPSWRAGSRCWSSPATPSHRGKLDPLAIGLPELREELASSYLLELLRDPPPSWENAIDRAVRDAVRAGERSLLGVVARLRASRGRGRPRGRRGARGALGLRPRAPGLRATRRGRAASMAERVGDHDPHAGPLLPDPGASRETYTRAERVSVATLSLVAAQALRLVSGRPQPTQDRAPGRGVVPARPRRRAARC